MTDKTHPNHYATVRFKKVGDTKGTVRYVEINAAGEPVGGDAEGQVIGTLYLRKAKLNGKTPDILSVDIDTPPV